MANVGITPPPSSATLGGLSNVSSMGMMSMGFSAISGVMSGISSIIQGKAYEKAAKRARKQAEANAKILEQLGVIGYEMERSEGNQVLEAIRADPGARGYTVGTGTHQDILNKTAMDIELAARRRQYGYESAAYKQRVEGDTTAYQAEVAAFGARMTAGQQFMGGVQQAALTGAYLQGPPEIPVENRGMFTNPDTGDPILPSLGTADWTEPGATYDVFGSTEPIPELPYGPMSLETEAARRERLGPSLGSDYWETRPPIYGSP